MNALAIRRSTGLRAALSAAAWLLVVSLSPVTPRAAVAPDDSLVTNVVGLQDLAAQIRAYELSLRPPWFEAYRDSFGVDSTMAVVGIKPDGYPVIYRTFNCNAGRTNSVDSLCPGGASGLNLTGANDWGELAIWDLGRVTPDHPEWYTTGMSRIRWPISELLGGSPHANHCAGTMIAAGLMANPHECSHGMSPAAFLDSYDWEYDLSEMPAAAAEGLLVSNHSYGQALGWALVGGPSGNPICLWFGYRSISEVEDYWFGYYGTESRRVDEITFEAPYYTIVQAAGNDRGLPDNAYDPAYVAYWFGEPDENGVRHAEPIPRCTPAYGYSGCPQNDMAWLGGYDTIGPPGTAKNSLTVGAVYGTEAPHDSNTIDMTDYSAWGPTDDGRIKPDVVADGGPLYSAGTGHGYTRAEGTSMACAGVSGAVNLLVQYYKDWHGGAPPRSATVKALVVHTANRVNADFAPDYRHGWGLIDAEAAAELIRRDAWEPALIQQRILPTGLEHGFLVYADGSEPLLATIAWTDPPGPQAGSPEYPLALDPATPVLVNDLDLRITRVADGHVTMPFVLNPAAPAAPATRGDNCRDNVEKVAIIAPQPGYYQITVGHKGVLQGGSQPYSLVHSGGMYPSLALLENKSAQTGLTGLWTGDPYSAAVIDYDRDGLTDLILTLKEAAGMIFRCRWIDEDGVPAFVDASEPCFPDGAPQPGSRGIAVADYDNDGWDDVFIAHATAPRLYRNLGDGTFSDQAEALGVSALAQQSWTGAWGDYDRDGRLDLLVGRWDYHGQHPDPIIGGGASLRLLRNETAGGGGFTLRNAATGLDAAPALAGIAVCWTDIDGDGRLDIFAGNLTGGGRLFRNTGYDYLTQDERYEDVTGTRMVQPPGQVSASLSADVDGDGALDLAVGRMAGAGIELHVNEDGTWQRVYGPLSGLLTDHWASGLTAIDFDLDGRQDLLLLPADGDGHPDLFVNSPPGEPLRFANLGAQVGFDTGYGSGVVANDFNLDGDQDLFFGRSASQNRFYYRALGHDRQDGVPRHSLSLRLAGSGCDNNRNGIGALVDFRFTPALGATIVQRQLVDGGSGRGCQQARSLTFATGDQGGDVQVDVRWPNGRRQQLSLAAVQGGAVYTVSEPEGAPEIERRSVSARCIALPGQQAIWEFKWRTLAWSNPALDRVTVRDTAGTPPACQIGQIVLSSTVYGVNVTVEEHPQGGYWHIVTWEGIACAAPCSYRYDVRSTHACQQDEVLDRTLEVTACLE